MGQSISSYFAPQSPQQPPQQPSYVQAPIASPYGAYSSAVSSVTYPVQQAIQGPTTVYYNTSNAMTEQVASQIQQAVSNLNLTQQYQTSALQNLLNQQSFNLNSLSSNLANQLNASFQGQSNSYNNAISQMSSNFSNIELQQSNILGNAINGLNSSLSNVLTQSNQANQQTIQWLTNYFQQNQNLIAQQFQNALAQGQNQLGQELSMFDSAINQLLGGLPDIIQAILKSITGLGELSGQSISDWIANQENDFVHWLVDRLTYAGKVLQQSGNNIEDIFQKLVTNQYSSLDQLENDLQLGQTGSDVIDILLSIMAIVGFVFSLQNIMTAIIESNVIYLVNDKLRNKLLDTQTYVELMFKNPTMNDYYTNLLHKLGFNDEQIHNLQDSFQPLLSLNEANQAIKRGYINDVDYAKLLQQYGYTNTQIDTIRQLLYIASPVSHFIDNYQRSLYDDNYAQMLGLDSNLPGNIEEIAFQYGYIGDILTQMYRGSWTIPSIPELVQMRNRGLIDDNTLNYTLVNSNIAPYFRDRLVTINQPILEKRELKALHKLGVISDTDVYTGFKRLGYSDTDARHLADYTIRYDSENTPDGLRRLHELSENTIKSAFDEGIIDEQTAISKLVSIGYVIPDAQFIVSTWDFHKNLQGTKGHSDNHKTQAISAVKRAYFDYAIEDTEAINDLMALGYTDVNARQEILFWELDRNLEQKTKIVDSVKHAYEHYDIEESDVVQLLTYFAYTPNQQSEIIGQANLVRTLNKHKPSLSELDHFLKLGIIQPQDYLDYLSKLGYSDDFIAWKTQELIMKSGGV